MSICYHEGSREFHLYNKEISYLITILKNGQLGQLYFGKKLHDRESFSHLLELRHRPMAVCTYEGDSTFSMEHIKQEYPSYGAGDMRYPAVEILQENGSRITNFVYQTHRIYDGKPALAGLPATYTEDSKEAQTLEIELKDELIDTTLILYYTIFEELPVITRSAKVIYHGAEKIVLERAMSCSVDLPDHDYQMIELTGAWGRERAVTERKLQYGIQGIYSMRGCSSSNFNPFLALRRENTTEACGEVYGFSLVYSGNFLAQAEVDTYDVTRVTLGIHPDRFSYNWEATYFDFNEEKILEIVRTAKQLGIELFVLDDGWFGKREDDHSSLGDWYPNLEKLPDGIAGIAKKVAAEGMKFGLWFEPEMVSKDSNLYREHPDWILSTPGRHISHGRNQYILDFSRAEVVDAIYGQMEKILEDAPISYIKWDMNRCMSEVYSHTASAADQGKVMHQYILGVYRLYEKLTARFPEILFESCASGGSRFDPGLLYYAPQAWTSDDTDAVERCKIQYGTSLVYPVSSMGSHVSAVPNHQVLRNTSLKMRADVAYFGTFGYELNPNSLTEAEREAIKKQTAFMKEHRSLIQYGTFYRLQSPFAGNEMAWMVVSEDKKEAIVGWYRFLEPINIGYRSVRLQGLDPKLPYQISNMEMALYGDELMQAGLIVSDVASGQNPEQYNGENGDFQSRLYLLKAKEE